MPEKTPKVEEHTEEKPIEEEAEEIEEGKQKLKETPKPEEKKLEEESEEGTSGPNPVEDAKELLTNLKAENKRFETNIKELKKVTAEGIVSGRAIAGKEKTQDDKDTEAAKKLIAGTGFEDELFPAKKE